MQFGHLPSNPLPSHIRDRGSLAVRMKLVVPLDFPHSYVQHARLTLRLAAAAAGKVGIMCSVSIHDGPGGLVQSHVACRRAVGI